MPEDNPVERAKEIIVAEERKPILYDHKDRPLTRPLGFQARKEVTTRE